MATAEFLRPKVRRLDESYEAHEEFCTLSAATSSSERRTRQQVKSPQEVKMANFSTQFASNRSSSSSSNKSASLRVAQILVNLLAASTLLDLLQVASHRSLEASNFLAPPSASLVLLAEGATAAECTSSDDCRSDKICHENKCICGKDRPIEDQDRCLAHAQIGEQCTINEQCLGNSICLEGLCSCGTDGISVFNPSSKINYCHPKRKLNESCIYDLQCPSSAYCSTKDMGCLCSNGYGQLMVNMNGVESAECLPKTCTDSSNCESEYHHCNENRCTCDATHWDPTTARCYKFGSLQGSKDGLGELNEGNATSTSNDDTFHSILKDLMENSDKLWIVIVLLIILTTFILLLIFMLLRKHYLGYCWTAHKKEYEPNNKSGPKNGQFNKNSINNKSFKRKNGDVEDNNCDNNNLDDNYDDDERVGLASKGAAGRGKQQDHHRIDMSNSNTNNTRHEQTMIVTPLKSSTSTPV